jgi:hypothetical protein
MSLRPIFLALLLTSACRTAPARPLLPPAAQTITVRKAGVEVQVSCAKGSDAAELGRIGSGFLDAASHVSRWGTFKSRVQVVVLEDHAALEEALRWPGLEWLRAWAYDDGDRVLLQSPRTWDPANPGLLREPDELSRLISHELTHALMYQLIKPEDGNALAEAPPFWFSEGMASVTADQGKMRLPPQKLAEWLKAHPGENPLDPDAELLRTEKEAVYGAAHRAFERLLALGGDQAVRDVLRGMRSGARFSDAFAAATGQKLGTFERATLQSGFAAGVLPKPASGAGGP